MKLGVNQFLYLASGSSLKSTSLLMKQQDRWAHSVTELCFHVHL